MKRLLKAIAISTGACMVIAGIAGGLMWLITSQPYVFIGGLYGLVFAGIVAFVYTILE